MFFTLITGMIVLCLFDFKLVKGYFDQYTSWIKLNPQEGICYSILLVSFSIVMTIPITYSIIMIGYTYAQVYES